MTPTVSILIPTRARLSRLKRTLGSLRDTATSESSYEVLLRIDADDTETIMAFKDCPKNLRTVKGPRLGYGAHDKMYSELADKARAPWVWILNDDCEISGTGWDTLPSKVATDGWIIHAENYQLNASAYLKEGCYQFPIVPNHCWRRLGKELAMPVDAMLDQFLRTENGWKVHLIPGVTIFHDRDNDTQLEEHRKL